MAKGDKGAVGSHGTVKALYVACAVVAVAHAGLVLFTDTYSHAHFAFEGWPLFPALFGFVAFGLLVMGSKLLRRLVKRAEDYYGDDVTIDTPPPTAAVEGSGHHNEEGSGDARAD